MKLRSYKFGIVEGMVSVFANKLMTLASVTIVAASLFILGIILLLSENVNYNIKVLESLPEIQAFLDTELSNDRVLQIEKQIASMDKVAEYEMISKEQAFENAKQLLGDKQHLLEGLEKENPLPVSFRIKVKSPKDGPVVVEAVKGISGVENVKYAFDLAKRLSEFAGATQIVSTILIAILGVISVFIISNTIKLTVFARRKEISIMKYVGATDGFIRWPFVVEGIVIGILGSALSFLLIYLIYRYSVPHISASLSAIKLLTFRELSSQLILIYFFMGTVLGASGSFISIRKYLRV